MKQGHGTWTEIDNVYCDLKVVSGAYSLWTHSMQRSGKGEIKQTGIKRATFKFTFVFWSELD